MNRILKTKYLKKIKKFKLRFPLHPFLFAVFPILFFFSHNINEVLINVTFLPIIISLFVISITLLSLIKFGLRDKNKAGILTSVIVLLFFSYGHIKNFIFVGDFTLDLKIATIGPDKTLLTIWVAALIASAYFLLKFRSNLNYLTRFLNILAVILITLPLINIISYEAKTTRILKLLSNTKISEEITPQNPNKTSDLPDIYYLIFDRFSGIDTLENVYNYDTSEFTGFLEEKGFYVASKSNSNYPASFLSIASSLNMEYINYLAEELGEDSGDQTPAFEMIQNFKIQSLLKSIGYRYIHIGNAWEPTRRNKNADKNFTYKPENLGFLDLDEFSTKLLETTILPPILTKLSSQKNQNESAIRIDHRNRAIYQYETLLEIPDSEESPKFVFAHFIFPHPAYVLDEDCKSITEEHTKKIGELKNYLNQLTCASDMIKDVINKILESKASSTIIILQSDTGPIPPIKSTVSDNFAVSNKEALQEMTGILNAYYLPGKDKKILYRSITPVNTFRLIFNLYFETNYELLPDKVYMLEDLQHQYKLHDITSKVN